MAWEIFANLSSAHVVVASETWRTLSLELWLMTSIVVRSKSTTSSAAQRFANRERYRDREAT